MLTSFVIRYHTRRLDNLLQTLRFLNLWHKDVVSQSEVILLCQDKCGEIQTNFKQTKNFNMDLSEMSMSKQLNFGVKNSTSDLIVLLDSDRILPNGYYTNIIQKIQPKEMISTLKMYKIPHMASDEDIINGEYGRIEEWRSTNNKSLTRNIFSGNVLFWKKDFIEVGGADEGYLGYGFEDHDLTESMIKIGVNPIFDQETIELHLFHELKSYGSQDQKKLFINNGIRYCKKWKKPYPSEIVESMSKYSKVLL